MCVETGQRARFTLTGAGLGTESAEMQRRLVHGTPDDFAQQLNVASPVGAALRAMALDEEREVAVPDGVVTVRLLEMTQCD